MGAYQDQAFNADTTGFMLSVWGDRRIATEQYSGRLGLGPIQTEWRVEG